MGDALQEPVWNDDHAEAAADYLQRYFGGLAGLSSAFPCLRDHYPWADFRHDVADSRVPAKNNTEYHGLEELAGQYHAAAMYEEASHHWLMAAWSRKDDMDAHGFGDAGHKNALSFCLKNFAFNRALKNWSDAGRHEAVPAPSRFGLTEKRSSEIEAAGAQALDLALRTV
ncbi:MAG: hypothetical protein FJX25_03955 [Alphaproteobacteria bacterium]|nr:hypothetical protein [Alphaproteobacteria bacterium]